MVCEVLFVSDENAKNIRVPNKRIYFKTGEAVMVRWDAIPELDEPEVELPQRLLPSKWNLTKVTRDA